MTEGTRGEGRKGPGHSSEALTGWCVDGKVLILEILGILPNSKTSHSSPYGDLLPKASFSRDINLEQIRVQLKRRDAPIVSLQPRCVYHEDPWMRLGNKIFGDGSGGVYASLTIQGLSDRFRLEVLTILIVSVQERIRV